MQMLIPAFMMTAGVGASSDWRPLFNGTDLSGWCVMCKADDPGESFWTVHDGAIVADSLRHEGHDYVWLMTDEEFDDFELRLKFQAYRDSPGNSGVQVRSRYDREDGGGWLNGPQVDINPPGPWRTGMIWDETRGNQRWLWPEVPKGEWVDESMTEAGLVFNYSDDEPAWNELLISVCDTRMRAILNGVQVMYYNGAGVLDDENHREHNVGMSGHIALQIHTGDQLKIAFKDIEVRGLNR